MTDLLLELPREVLALIIRHLSPAQLSRVLETCSAWSQCFGSALHTLAPTGIQHLSLLKRFPYLQHLDLSKNSERLKTEDLSQLQHLPELRKLNLQGCSSISDLHFLAGITGIQHLDLRQCRNLLPGCLGSLFSSKLQLRKLLCDGCTSLICSDLLDAAELSSLEHLSLAACSSIVCRSLHPLGRLPRLMHLNMSGTRCLKDAGIASLAPAPSLQELRLDCCANFRGRCLWQLAAVKILSLLDCQSVDDEGLGCIAQLPALRALILDECDRITDAGIAALAAASQLQHLSLRACRVTGMGLSALEPKYLRMLKLSSCMYLSHEGADAIAQLTALEELSLAHAGWVGDTFIQSIGSLSKLTALNLSYCPDITQRTIQRLSVWFPMLARLQLANCTSIRDESAGDICKLRHLAELDVSCCSLTDEGTTCLQQRLPHLQTLNVAGSQISEAGARHLRTVPLLNIRACEGIAVDVQLLHSPIRFDHLRSSLSQKC